MRSTRLLQTLAGTLLVCALGGLPPAASAESGARNDKDLYVDEVVTILRTHVKAMRWLVNHNIKYSDNMVRHATAVEHAFGMLGPMDWHIAEAFSIYQESNPSEKLTEAQFNELAEAAQDSIDQLGRSARRFLRDGEKQRMLDSINAMMDACGACHSKLPKGSVPPVWKGMRK